MSDPDRFYVKLFRRTDLEWQGLSGLTRGLFGEILLLVNTEGRLRLGRRGIEALDVPMRVSWSELEPHVSALLDTGRIAVDGDHLVVPDFVRDQAIPKTSTERSQAKRARDAAQRDATQSNGEQRSGTDGDATPVPGDACNDKDQIRSDQPEEEEPAAAAAAAGVDQKAILAMLRFRPPLRAMATATNAATLAGHLIARPKRVEQVIAALDAVARDAQAEADNGSPWSPAHMAKQAAKYIATESGPRAPSPAARAEAPSVASQLPFHRADRTGS